MKLKPCPFCGEKANLYSGQSNLTGTYQYIQCNNCTARMALGSWSDEIRIALIKSWNKRTKEKVK